MSGLFGMYAAAAHSTPELIRLGLYALQHRGEKSAGMVVSGDREMIVKKGPGLVRNVFDDGFPSDFQGARQAIGHVRSNESPRSYASDSLPLLIVSNHGEIAIAHDGNLTNARQIKEGLLAKGALIQTAHDSELIAHLLAEANSHELIDMVTHVIQRIEGAYAVLMMTKDALIGFRDPLGIRPLIIGRQSDDWYMASESSAFDAVGAEIVRDLKPGELCVIDRDGLHSHMFSKKTSQAYCAFEFIYFARADSVMEGHSIHEVRKQFGRMAAREANIPADLVVPAPDSALSAAVGYSEQSGIPFDIGIVKNRYVGRTFTESSQRRREEGVQLKLNPIKPVIRGQRVILVDDSIVRGTTSARTIDTLRRAGAREVHMVVASPPFSHPCQYGIHIRQSDELIAANRSLQEICQLIGADSLYYLSHEAMYEALGLTEGSLCTACVGGDTVLTPNVQKLKAEDRHDE